MEASKIEGAADALLASRTAHRRMAALPEGLQPQTPEDGYAIQDALIAALAQPSPGWKIGGTSPLAQEMLKLDEPFAGRLLEPLRHDAPAALSADGFFMRGIEVEFALRLGRDLDAAGAPWDQESVADAVAVVHPAIEVVDSRFDDWLTVGTPSLIADNGCHGSLVLGQGVEAWRGTDLAEVGTELWMNGERVTSGSGAAVIGHPLAALAWLANLCIRRGGQLSAGQIISTGSTCDALGWAEATDRIEGRFGVLGTVGVTFT
ncbi:MAG: fumarylacetoacetate hydrolase family protein [Alphaproteobacteria bacterium]|jgi:2-keto-4-pentenoate hydratase|nr:fumarylacetoacetate hydrolase family protein [Alphaproteobacteria bacterium]